MGKSKEQLTTLANTAKLDASATFLLEKQKDYEPLNEKAARLEKQILLSKDPAQQKQLTTQLELVHEQREQLNNTIATNLTTLVIVVLWVSSAISNTNSIKITSILSSTTSSGLRIVSMRETLETKLESLKYG